MYQVIEEIEEKLLATVSESLVYGLVGKTSKELLGIIIESIPSGRTRRIYFRDIDRMKDTIQDMFSS